MRKRWLYLGGIALFALSAACGAQENTRNPNYDYHDPGYGPIKWPLRSQHLLAGHYSGLLQISIERTECASARAELWLEAAVNDQKSHRYMLKYTCFSGQDPKHHRETVTLRSTWWVDEIAGSCLILEAEPDPRFSYPSPAYGFRIDETDNPKLVVAALLSQDGANCQSGGGSEYHDKILKRVH
ncbi:hypothetical protein [Xanthomonas campestris]|uniref:hypothetical protein n=1 Tax=Xanthomonas campestris TaxID=339 RepID=UPI001E3B0790|nr:hypothetical protein [Xanthomonas campestris]MCC5072376.1 hypothetical protein [Xanthomonas campestris pv. plantaginis]